MIDVAVCLKRQTASSINKILEEGRVEPTFHALRSFEEALKLRTIQIKTSKRKPIYNFKLKCVDEIEELQKGGLNVQLSFKSFWEPALSIENH